MTEASASVGPLLATALLTIYEDKLQAMLTQTFPALFLCTTHLSVICPTYPLYLSPQPSTSFKRCTEPSDRIDKH